MNHNESTLVTHLVNPTTYTPHITSVSTFEHMGLVLVLDTFKKFMSYKLHLTFWVQDRIETNNKICTRLVLPQVLLA